MENLDRFIDYYSKHLVPIVFTFSSKEATQNLVITSFLLSVQSKWYLVTAGHCLKIIEKLIQNEENQLLSCNLVDYLGLEAKDKNPIPFIYSKNNTIWWNDNHDSDYGVIPLSLYYKQLLLVNNVQALNEETWKKQPSKVDFYLLIGFPAELVSMNLNVLNFGTSIHIVEKVSEKPLGFSDTNLPQFYGKILLRNTLESIKGISGGPILAFHKNHKGECRYWLTAVQSSWLPNSEYIKACPISILGNYLEYLHGDEQ